MTPAPSFNPIRATVRASPLRQILYPNRLAASGSGNGIKLDRSVKRITLEFPAGVSKGMHGGARDFLATTAPRLALMNPHMRFKVQEGQLGGLAGSTRLRVELAETGKAVQNVDIPIANLDSGRILTELLSLAGEKSGSL